MDLRQLQQFLAVIDHGTVGRAARQLQLSQPALSQSLARLEAQLKVPLFERTGRGMVPTPFGTALAGRARNISLEARRALEDIDTLRDSGRVQVAIGTVPSLANTVVAEAVRRLQIVRPKAQVSLLEGGAHTLLPALERGAVDMVVGTADPTDRDRALTCQVLFHDQVTVMAHRDHPLAGRRAPTLSDCLAHPWALPGRGDKLRQKIDSLFVGAGLGSLTVRVETNSAIAIKALLIRGDYLGFLPRGLTHVEEQAGLLLPLAVPGMVWERHVQVVYPQRKAMSPVSRALIAHLRRVGSEYRQSSALRRCE